jgi:hypothetical protein
VRVNFTTSAFWRGPFLALAAVAVAVLVIVPPGYMVGAGKTSGPPRIVICTGHGPVTAAIDLGSAPAKPTKAGGPCAFAAHAGAAPIPSPAILPGRWKPAAIAHAILVSQVTIGRGLAAPPPARGPPALL